MQEATHYGCIPVVPARLAYVDVYDQAFQYQNLDHAAQMIVRFAKNYGRIVQGPLYAQTEKRLHDSGYGAIERIVTEIRAIGGNC